MEISKELKELYDSLNALHEDESGKLFVYYRWLVRNTDRDYLFMAYKQLQQIFEDIENNKL